MHNESNETPLFPDTTMSLTNPSRKKLAASFATGFAVGVALVPAVINVKNLHPDAPYAKLLSFLK